MSWQLVRQVFETSKAKPMARLVLINLAERAGENGRQTAWPSRETIARECGLSIRGAHSLLRYLRRIGEIEFVDGTSGGRSKTNRYRITLKNPAPDAGFCESKTVHVETGNPAARAPEPEEPERVPSRKFRASKSAGRQKAAGEDLEW